MKGQKGITLVALIITIVVLLILAVAAISALNQGQVVDQTNNAVTKWNEGVKNETNKVGNSINVLNHYWHQYK